jgi:hypothetical protein
MNNIYHIKPIYEPHEIQDDLRKDSMTLFAMNMAANFYRYENRVMTKKEIDNCIKFLYNKLLLENGHAHEWNQTS